MNEPRKTLKSCCIKRGGCALVNPNVKGEDWFTFIVNAVSELAEILRPLKMVINFKITADFFLLLNYYIEVGFGMFLLI